MYFIKRETIFKVRIQILILRILRDSNSLSEITAVRGESGFMSFASLYNVATILCATDRVGVDTTTSVCSQLVTPGHAV